MIVALQTARAGSKSVPNKNITDVGGHPLFYHNIVSCLGAKSIEKVFISTNCEFIKNYELPNGIEIIHRPDHLCGDDSSHKETMKHGIEARLCIQKKKNFGVTYT